MNHQKHRESHPRRLRSERTRRAALRCLLAMSLALGIGVGGCRASDLSAPRGENTLPAPKTVGSVSLEAALAGRKPVNGFAAPDLTANDVAQLLWAAQGVIIPGTEVRTVPSPGSVHALDVWVARADGVHHYIPSTHTTTKVVPMDVRKQLAQATGDADELRSAPVLIVITGQPGKARPRYGDRAERMVAIEGGHAAQNLLLQAGTLGLAATPLGLVDDEAIRSALVLSKDHMPIHIIAVGLPAR